jgi:hypothetical protein
VSVERHGDHIAVRSSGTVDGATVQELETVLRRSTSTKHGLVLDLRSTVGLNVDHVQRLLSASEEQRRKSWAVLLFPEAA